MELPRIRNRCSLGGSSQSQSLDDTKPARVLTGSLATQNPRLADALSADAMSAIQIVCQI
jgi:hypothetical protein